MFAESVSYPAAFFAGLLAFFSPCILPLIPAYFTLITGFSLKELTEGTTARLRRKVFISTLAYVLGFSVVFVAMGASASWLGVVIQKYRDFLRITGGIVIIIFGIHLTGIIRLRILDFEKKIHMKGKPVHFWGIFALGMVFSAGWSPCIGPILGSILIIAGSQTSVWQGVLLLSLFSFGLALPFLVMSVFINLLLAFVKKVSPKLRYVNMIAGVLLIIIGGLILTNKFYLIGGP